MEFRTPRGTADILPADQPYWSHARAIAARVAAGFGYSRIDTPVFEDTTLFARGVGGDTDVVEKEMYTFSDRGGDSLTLKAEGTAPVCRAYIQHGMGNLPQPVRLFYVTPIFRYDRPQAGRFRQHYQFGVEAIGDASPEVDAEVIELGWSFLARLGLAGLALKVNSIGDGNCRPRYVAALRDHYREHLDEMCRDCRGRHARNPLRLLDCKKETCQRFAGAAPRSLDYLCDDCAVHWESLRGYLDSMAGTFPGMGYEIDHRLVRGLDYYTRTVFEIQPPEEGGQSTILGGGRYDGLIELLGGSPTPGIGFGSGLDRIVLNLRRQKVAAPGTPATDVVVLHVGDVARARAFELAGGLRAAGLSAVLAPAGRSLRSQMRYADGQAARFALILGDRDLERGVATLRPLDGGDQTEVCAEADAIAAAIRRG